MLLSNIVQEMAVLQSSNRLRRVLSFCVFSLCLCISSRDAVAAIQVVSSPVVAAAPNAPLSGTLSFATDVPTRASFKVEGNNEAWWVDSSQLNTNHSIPLLGFAPDSSYTISNIRLSTTGGAMKTTLGDQLPFATPALPANIVDFEVEISNPSEMEPGLTLFGVTGDHTVALDAQGTVRWYVDFISQDVRRKEDDLFVGRVGGAIKEFDVLGNETRGWYPSSSPGQALAGRFSVTSVAPFHHDVFPMANGNFLILTTRDDELVSDFPTSETDPTPAPHEIVTDIILEFAPDGSIVHSWDMSDMLDTNRIGYDTFRANGTADWSHANAVYHDPEDINDPLDDTIVVSLRHQDAVVKFSRETGELKWILGNHDSWDAEFQQYLLTPAGDPNDFQWQYHQHAPMKLPDGTIMLMDNANHQATPFDGETVVAADDTFSRAVLYDIDEDLMTVEQLWEYGTPETADQTYFTRTRGDADWLSQTGNSLITYTHVVRVDGAVPSSEHTRIVEIDQDGNEVFRLQIGDTGANAYVYRSERIPSLYPSGYTVRAVPSPSSGLLLAVAMLTLNVCNPRRLKLQFT